MNFRKAISPVIATIIIVAIALTITIAAVGWMMGLWGTVAGGTEQLQILPDSYLNLTNGETKVILHISNKGTAAAVIYKVEVVGLGTIDATQTVSLGTDTTFTLTLNTACTEGIYYLVKVYTKAGNVYQAHLLCKVVPAK